MPDHLLAIDQGTTSSRAIVFDRDAQPLATAQQEFAQHYAGCAGERKGNKTGS
mgnify:CR=1 FL=1